MESDNDFRIRVLAEHDHCNGAVPTDIRLRIIMSVGSNLDALGAVWFLTRDQASPPPDPFGDAVHDAQEPRPDPDPTYTPDDFTAQGFDTDAAYRPAMGGGS